LRSLLKLPVTLDRVVVNCGAAGPSALGIPGELLQRLPVEFASSSDPFAKRLADFLALTGERSALLLDGATVADARLHLRLPLQREARAVIGGDGEDQAAMLFLPDATAAKGVDVGASLGDFATRLMTKGLAHEFRQADFDGFIRNLRRSLPFYLFTIVDKERAAEVERFMFWSNYKGSTDLFTRYVYPPAVWFLVRPLARARVHPNWVTIASIVMTFAAIPFFSRGDFVIGFVLAYGMSILDSVDGKLARLTFTDSPLGNILDHGLDIIHPPLWYLSWAYGLGLGAQPWTSPLGLSAIAIFAFYVIDRLILKIYPRFFGRGFHTHSQMDARVRAVIARRNINLPVFLIGWAFGLGVQTFYLITLWQALTALYHGSRTFWIIAVKSEHKSAPRGPAEIAAKRLK
jgi:phosphatidylglycerophosphate synthase